MSLFVRLNVNFFTSRKTAKLRAKIGDAAFWVPPRIWTYAAEHQPDGVFEGYDPAEFCLLIGYSGDAQALLEALLQAGFMDNDPLRIHDWHDHNNYHVTFASRAKAAAKARWDKQRAREEEERLREEKRREEASIASSICLASDELGLNFPQHLRTEPFKAKFNEWIALRRGMKKSKDWVQLFQRQLNMLSEFPEPTAIAILTKSLVGEYQGLFPDAFRKEDPKPKQPKSKYAIPNIV